MNNQSEEYDYPKCAHCVDYVIEHLGPNGKYNVHEFFVPGRVCVVGEHADWAGELESSVSDGRCLAYATDVGIHAWAWRRAACTEQNCILHSPNLPVTVPDIDNQLMFSVIENHNEDFLNEKISKIEVASQRRSITVPLTYKDLSEAAMDPTNYFAYACGSAAAVLDRFPDLLKSIAKDPSCRGITLFSDYTTLPMKKGFSSSAAICVLVVQAFFKVFNMFSRRESNNVAFVEKVMDIACRGEWNTPSKCGRMDQCCAFGKHSVTTMRFRKRTHLDLLEDVTSSFASVLLTPGSKFYFVVADLNAGKNTQRILNDLHVAFAADTVTADDVANVPNWNPADNAPDSAASLKVHLSTLLNSRNSIRIFLGPETQLFVRESEAAIKQKDAAYLGMLMSLYQSRFDVCMSPHCPEELMAPKLHKMLSLEKLQPLVLGGKGVGSQGDGAVQFICSSAEYSATACEVLREEGCHPFSFVLAST